MNQYITDFEKVDFDYENNENSKDDDLNDEMKTLIIEFLSFSSPDKFSATETFMISFESMKTSRIMIIDLANRSFSHFFIKQFIVPQIGLKDDEVNAFQIGMKNIDFFTYMIVSARYICYAPVPRTSTPHLVTDTTSVALS